ncbi:hypothetical protein [Pararhodospirillum photometricum]|uniref:hypothetical protein n=1 Tax=Pararhodospirillum photometricum TaxID=1084 RepID=UPI000307C8DE|nr:hypothetical protein [Pararhodospirillum photometricum]
MDSATVAGYAASLQLGVTGLQPFQNTPPPPPSQEAKGPDVEPMVPKVADRGVTLDIEA